MTSEARTSPLAKRVLDEHAAVRESLPAGVVSAARRREAIEALAAQGLPLTREENWRYSNLRPLERARFAPVAAADSAASPLLPADSELPARLAGFARYVFIDGAYAPQLSSPLELAGVTVRNLRGSAAKQGELREEHTASLARLPRALPAAGRVPEARLALLNEAFATDTASIHVSAAAEEPPRVELAFLAVAGADAGTSYPRVHVALDPGARLILLERHVGTGGGASFVISSIDVEISRGAQLTHYRLQQAGARATWFDTLAAVLAAEARYNLLAIHTGALSARSTSYVQMAGAGAQLTFSALALGERQQVQDNLALVEHLAPRASTEQTFRGIASGRARVAFNGKIAVRQSAPGTDSRQSLRGLLAGPDAEIDVRPQLEIYTDDVRCSHGATAGKLDEGMLFYLLSRGLAPEVAQRLLKWAFLEDVVSRIDLPEVRRQIERELAGQLPDVASPQEIV
jgi:Fe-S cluster assembly protein SufD